MWPGRRVYAVFEKHKLGSGEHVQLTYTAWYPAHPRMKTIDLEEADIDSCVVRVTLDSGNGPLLYETIAACGCFHKVFVENWLEESARTAFGGVEKDKKFAVERTVKSSIDWEVAGVVDQSREKPRRPVVFLKAGEHKVLGMGSAARLRLPSHADVRTLRPGRVCRTVRLDGGGGSREEAVLRSRQGRQGVGSGTASERFLMNFAGVDNAGHRAPRSDQAPLRPEHLERHDHLRALPETACGHPLTLILTLCAAVLLRFSGEPGASAPG